MVVDRISIARSAAGLAEFAGRLHEVCNQIDGQDQGNNDAYLRWFILDEGCRGTGTGKRLLNEAMAFSDAQGFSTVQLWTFSGLNAARRLYESFGFTLTKEWQGDQWGMMMTEQQFSRVGAG
nr:GNAT family N-acetyltransferase [Siccibacter colletis]